MRAILICLATILPLAVAATAAPVAVGLEKEPELPTSSLVAGRVPLEGAGYRLPQTTPIRQFMGRFRLETDLGTLEAVGTDELLQRLAELPAARRLQTLERSDMFAQALAQSARDTGKTLVRVVSHPVETLTALPAGIGRALLKVGRGARNVATGIGDASQRASSAQATQDSASPPDDANGEAVIDFAKELGGVNAARRAIALDLGIDPYTRNPLIAARLGSLAWASVAGGVSLDLALAGVSGEVRSVLGNAARIDSLAWDLPPADIRRQLEQRLRKRGHSGFAAREFLRNASFSPSDQLRFVQSLETIDQRQSEGPVLELATRLSGPRQARFLQRQLDVLVAQSARAPLQGLLVADNLILAETDGKALILPLPVDHLAWTTELAEVVKEERAAGTPLGLILVTGSASRTARSQLAALGWRVEQVALP